MSRSREWKLDRTNNLETVVNTRLRVAIAVMGGDEFTGHRGAKLPRVRRKRGPATHARVRQNRDWMPRLFEMPGDGDEDLDLSSLPVWLLLVRATDEELYVELSLPTEVNASGYVTGWGERILLPKIPTTGGVTPIEEGDDDTGFAVVAK